MDNSKDINSELTTVDKLLTPKSENVKVNTFGVEKDGIDWTGEDINVKSDPIVDPGTGKPYLLRIFEFAKNPEFKGKITKQDLFNMHWRQIRNVLWGDGLVATELVNPRVEFTKDNKYRIFILAEPRLRTVLTEKPMRLNDALNKRKK